MGVCQKGVPHNKLKREVKFVFPLWGYNFKIDLLPMAHNVLGKKKDEIGKNVKDIQ